MIDSTAQMTLRYGNGNVLNLDLIDATVEIDEPKTNGLFTFSEVLLKARIVLNERDDS